MKGLQELKSKLEDERDFEIKQLGGVYEKDELLNIGATIYAYTKVIEMIKEMEGED